MDFLNKLGNMASETYKKTSKKTGELAKEAKLRMQMNEDKAKIKDLYEEIGKIVYQKYMKQEKISIEEDLNSYCTQIDELSNNVEKSLGKLLTLKGKRICDNCHTEIDVKVKFCPTCGTEQPEIPIIEEVEKNDVGADASICPKAENNENDVEEVKEAEIIEEDKKDNN